MKQLSKGDLKKIFIESLNQVADFSYDTGNPFLINIHSKQFFIFLKNLSPAYFKGSPDVTRVQLPYSIHFSKVSTTNTPFAVIGYDNNNDVIVSWDPKKTRERLNAKSNVSLYCRSSFQDEVQKNEFKTAYLTNGQKIILFKREYLPVFFKFFQDLFDGKQIEVKDFINISESEDYYISNKLNEITDKDLLQTIEPLLKNNKVLESVEICRKFYEGKYNNMLFKDWFYLVNQLYQKVSS